MKKVVSHLFLITACLITTSCGPSKADIAEQARQDSIQRADSIATIQKERARQAAIKDSLAWVNFSSPDLFAFNLHGHVKNVSTGADEDEFFPNPIDGSYSFTKEGKLIVPQEDFYVEKDKQGRVVSLEWRHENGTLIYSLGYNSQGIVNSSSHLRSSHFRDYEYKIDKNGYASSYTYYGMEPFEYEGYGSIQYLDFDKYGNWVKAKIQDTFLRLDEYGEDSNISKEHSTNIVTRKITYYKQEK